jgi:hypothetical protein
MSASGTQRTYTTVPTEAHLGSKMSLSSLTFLWHLSQQYLNQLNDDIHRRCRLYCPEPPSEIAPLMSFPGISGFNSGVRRFSFPGPEFIDYPQDENNDNEGFLKNGIIHKE